MALCIDFTVDESGSAEPTRDKNIICRHVPQEGVQPPPRLGRLANRSRGCGPVGQAIETVMGRKTKKICTRFPCVNSVDVGSIFQSSAFRGLGGGCAGFSPIRGATILGHTSTWKGSCDPVVLSLHVHTTTSSSPSLFARHTR